MVPRLFHCSPFVAAQLGARMASMHDPAPNRPCVLISSTDGMVWVWHIDPVLIAELVGARAKMGRRR